MGACSSCCGKTEQEAGLLNEEYTSQNPHSESTSPAPRGYGSTDAVTRQPATDYVPHHRKNHSAEGVTDTTTDVKRGDDVSGDDGHDVTKTTCTEVKRQDGKLSEESDEDANPSLVDVSIPDVDQSDIDRRLRKQAEASRASQPAHDAEDHQPTGEVPESRGSDAKEDSPEPVKGPGVIQEELTIPEVTQSENQSQPEPESQPEESHTEARSDREDEVTSESEGSPEPAAKTDEQSESFTATEEAHTAEESQPEPVSSTTEVQPDKGTEPETVKETAQESVSTGGGEQAAPESQPEEARQDAAEPVTKSEEQGGPDEEEETKDEDDKESEDDAQGSDDSQEEDDEEDEDDEDEPADCDEAGKADATPGGDSTSASSGSVYVSCDASDSPEKTTGDVKA